MVQQLGAKTLSGHAVEGDRLLGLSRCREMARPIDAVCPRNLSAQGHLGCSLCLQEESFGIELRHHGDRLSLGLEPAGLSVLLV